MVNHWNWVFRGSVVRYRSEGFSLISLWTMVMNPKNHPTLENRYVMLFVVQRALLGGYLILGQRTNNFHK